MQWTKYNVWQSTRTDRLKMFHICCQKTLTSAKSWPYPLLCAKRTLLNFSAKDGSSVWACTRHSILPRLGTRMDVHKCAYAVYTADVLKTCWVISETLRDLVAVRIICWVVAFAHKVLQQLVTLRSTWGYAARKEAQDTEINKDKRNAG